MARRMHIIDRDYGWQRLKREISLARKKPHTAVGIFGEKAAADHGGIPNIQVATAHEFGATINHPGGTAYIVGSDGQANFVSNAAAQGRNLPRTKPHKIEIPERSFIRGTMDEKGKTIGRIAHRLFRTVLLGQLTTHKALEVLGLFIQGQIRQRISRGIAPPLKPATIKRKTVNGKAGTTPLIDTGQLRASIDFQVKNA